MRGAEIVGVCSRDLAKARQFGERHSVRRRCQDVGALLSEGRPDVVHITTPPDSHFDLAQRCLEHGAHVYVEKPFTVDAGQCETLVRLADVRGLKITVGHNQQFSPAARRFRALVKSGYLGGPAVHMESHYGYDLSDRIYARAVLEDRTHWVRSLPGQLLHNVISHGVARIAEFLDTDDPDVRAIAFTSPALRQTGEPDLMDELRVVINDGARTTAYFTFSSQMRPLIHEFRVFGPANGLLLDQDHEAVIRLRGRKFRSHADTFIPPLLLATQYVSNLVGNVARVLMRDLHMNSGMEYLIAAFYHSIRTQAPVPIPYREIVLTARIMDRIFEQLRDQRAPVASRHAVRVG